MEVFRLVQGKKTGEQFKQAIQTEFHLSGSQARAVAVRIGSDVLLPLVEYVQIPLREMIKQWGMDTDPQELLVFETVVKAFVFSLPFINDTRLGQRLISFLAAFGNNHSYSFYL